MLSGPSGRNKGRAIIAICIAAFMTTSMRNPATPSAQKNCFCLRVSSHTSAWIWRLRSPRNVAVPQKELFVSAVAGRFLLLLGLTRDEKRFCRIRQRRVIHRNVAKATLLRRLRMSPAGVNQTEGETHDYVCIRIRRVESSVLPRPLSRG